MPVLFIPGHAGSYKQIRAIAAEAAAYYYHHYASALDLQDRGMRTLDFFTSKARVLVSPYLISSHQYLNYIILTLRFI